MCAICVLDLCILVVRSLQILKKKFFYSDQSIDKNDPVQINLLYGQSKTAVVNGTHPCTQDEAVEVGSLSI